MVVRKMAWCCKAVQPSVARRSFHLSGWWKGWLRKSASSLALFLGKRGWCCLGRLRERCAIWHGRYLHKRMAKFECNRLVLRLRRIRSWSCWVYYYYTTDCSMGKPGTESVVLLHELEMDRVPVSCQRDIWHCPSIHSHPIGSLLELAMRST